MFLVKLLKRIFRKTFHRGTPIAPEVLDQLVFSWDGNTTYTYHWWPMKESIHNSLENNLYSSSGGLSKYDYLFCSKAVEYQKIHHFRENQSSESDTNWAGFCDSATILSCTREYPINSVRVNYNKKSILFTIKDIEALMIIASHESVDKKRDIFYGERNNGRIWDNPGEPYPGEFIKILKTICIDKIPFALDISKCEAVWNYSYNSVIVNMTNSPPIKFTHKLNTLPPDSERRYYNFIIKSYAYPQKNLNIWGWANTNNLSTGWLSEAHPDFIWKSYPKKGIWSGMCEINPEISAEIVRKIYMASITGINSIDI